MTSPVSVGQVSVEVIASAKALAKSLKREVESAFKDLDVSKAVQDSVGRTTIKLPVEPDVDTASIPEKIRRTRIPKIPVELDVDKGSAITRIGGLIKGLGRSLPNFGGIASTVSDLGGALQKTAGSSAQLGGSLAGAATTATGPIGLVIGLLVTAAGAMAALGTAAILVVPAVTAVAGAAAAIPAAIAGAGAAFGTLALGFKGIGAAFKPKVGGGGGGGGEDPASRARRIAAAERGVDSARRGIAAASRALQSAERGLADAEQSVVDAQKRAQQAQLAVNRARVDAREDIEDLNRSLRGAKLSEEDATLGVTEALRALNEAKLTGNLPDIQRADLAFRQAQQTLEDAKDTTEDLESATTDANRKGVEGSDQVQSALQDQRDALRGVKDAQVGVLDAQNAILSANDGLKSSYDGLKSAQDSLAESQKKVAAGGGAAAAEVVKLAPAAQKFVDAIKALKPAFEDLRLDVQQRLFEGLDKTVTNLGRAWIPALKVTLGSYADTFNTFFKNLGAGITTPKFIADIQAGAEGARKGMAAIGSSITSSLVPAFGALSRAAGPFMTQLGKEIAGVVTEFSNWVLEGEKTGGLKSFFDKASEAMHDMFTTGKLVTKIIVNILQAIIGPGAGKATAIDSFNEALQKVNDWLSKPENQQKIHNFVTGLGNATISIGRFVKSVADFINDVDRIATKIGNVFGGFTPDGTRPLGEAMWEGIRQGFSAAAARTGDFVAGLLWAGPNSLVGRIKAGLGIASPSTVMIAVGAELINGLIRGIGGTIGALVSAAGQLPRRIVAALGNPGSLLNPHGRNFVIGLINGIGSLFGSLGSRAAQLRTVISNQLFNAGSLLFNAGRAVINGLMSGISSALGSLGSFLGSVGSFIQAHKGPLDKDRQLLVGAGQAIMGGLITGIGDKKAALAAQLSDVSGLIAGTSMPALASDLGGVSASLNRSAMLELAWAPGSTSDSVYKAIQSDIKLRWSGNVQAALGSG